VSEINAESIQQLIDKIAEDIMLLDRKNLPGMGNLCNNLKELAKRINDSPAWPATGLGSDEIMKAEALVEDIIMEESNDPEADFNRVSKIITDIQAISNGWKPDATVDVSGKTDTETNESAPPPVLDETLLNAFIEQQTAVLPEIEKAILQYEKVQKLENLSGLKRIIHTMKGEAGVCGINDISTLCHKLEDYIDTEQESETSPENISPDILLEVKDWLAQFLDALSQKMSPAVSLEQILAKLSPAQNKDNQQSNAIIENLPENSNVSDDNVENYSPTEKSANQSVQSIPIGDPELAREFIDEANEHFDVIDENLLVLENEPTNTDAISAVFRAFHTIKGVAGFLGLGAISDLAHIAETLLDQVRKGERRFEGSVIEITFRTHDMLRSMVEDLRSALVSGTDFQTNPEFPALMASLKAIMEGSAEESLINEPTDLLSQVSSDNMTTSGQISEKDKSSAPSQTGKATGKNGIKINQTMRVDTAKIDNLLDTIGELVITESIVVSDPAIRSLKSITLEKNLALLDKITRSLQDAGMAMRLVPIDATFRKMERLVRDLCRKSGKKVNLIIEGGDTEIDKGMVEKLGDPLIHMIRNSMDHGIESADERQALGKNPIGQIVLRAYHKGGNIHIDIEDDGRGLNREAIVAKAIEKGVIESDNNMSDQEVYSLIFNAGFSTAKQVTEISGRGVGMDVVKRNIESMRGNVLIQSRPGKGSTFTIVLPLTMAIIDGMLAKVGSEVYIIPTLSIIESFRPTANMISTVTDRGEVVKFRDNLLPLIRLAGIFGVSGSIDDPTNATIMVIEERGRQWGLLLDEIIGQQQIVIKSLSAGLGNVPGIAGVSIMADGKPGLILDVAGLIKLATA